MRRRESGRRRTAPTTLAGSAIIAACALALAGCGGGMMNAETARQEILAADRAFSDLSATQGMAAAFTAYMDEDAVVYRDLQAPIEGAASIRALYADNPAGTLTWEPTFAAAAASGDLGYTLGRYLYRAQAPDGAPIVSEGYYVSIWRRQTDGTWKYVFDSGVRGPRPAADD